MFKKLIESNEEEAVRLAQAPKGSKSHFLSTLPVTIETWPRGLVIELPWVSGMNIVVVPYIYHGLRGENDSLEWAQATYPIRQDGYWTVIVVASNQPSYPVGGHDLSVSCAEIRRGKIITNFA